MKEAKELLKGKLINCHNSITIFDTNTYVKYEDALKIIEQLLIDQSELKRYDENNKEVEKPEKIDFLLPSSSQCLGWGYMVIENGDGCRYDKVSYDRLLNLYNQAKTADELLPGLVEELKVLKGFYVLYIDKHDEAQKEIIKLKADHKEEIDHALQAQSELMDEMGKKDERIKKLEETILHSISIITNL